MSSILSRMKDLLLNSKLHVFVLFVLALCILGYGLDTKQLYINEADGVVLAKMSIPDMFKNIWKDQSPAHYLLLHYWIKLFGDSEVSIRIPSVVFGALAVVFTYMLGLAMFGVADGFAGALLAALSPAMLSYSQQGRMYSMLLCLSILSLYLAYQYAVTRKLAYLIGFSLTITCSMYTHFFGFMVTSLASTFMFLTVAKDRKWKQILAMVVCFAVVGGAVVWQIKRIPGAVGLVDRYGTSWGLKPRVFFDRLYSDLWLDVSYYPLPDGIKPIHKDIFLWASLALAAWGMLWSQWRHKFLAFLWFVPPLVFGYLRSNENPVVARYFIFLMPVFALFVAHGIMKLRFRPVSAVVAVAVAGSLGYVTFDRYSQESQDWRSAVSFVKENYQPGDMVVLSPGWPIKSLEYYYGDGFDGIRKDVKRVWHIDGLEGQTRGYDRAIIVNSQDRFYGSDRRVEGWLSENFFQIQRERFKNMGVGIYDLLRITPEKQKQYAALEKEALTAYDSANASVSLMFAGNLNLSGDAARLAEKSGPGAPFEFLGDLLAKADLRFGNLEAPFTASSNEKRVPPQPAKGADPAAAEGLRSAGFDLINLGNEAFSGTTPGDMELTYRLLNERGIAVLGAVPAGDDGPQQPYVKEIKGVKFAFLSYSQATPGRGGERPFRVFKADPATVASDVARARELADVVIVSMHWGSELDYMPTRDQVNLAHTAVDSGAALVVGHHPRVLQQVEQYGGGTIVYSLGGLVSDFKSLQEEVMGNRALVLNAVFDRAELTQARLIPVLVNKVHQPTVEEPRFSRVPSGAELQEPLYPGQGVLYDFAQHLSECDVSLVTKGKKPEKYANWTVQPRGGIPVIHERWEYKKGGPSWKCVGFTRASSDGLIQDGIWAHPVKGSDLTIRFRNVPVGEAIRGSMSLSDFAVKTRDGAKVPFAVSVAGEKLVKTVVENKAGWVRFRVDTSKWAGTEQDVVFTVNADGKTDNKRHFCFNAYSLDEQQIVPNQQAAETEGESASQPVATTGYDFLANLNAAKVKLSCMDGTVTNCDAWFGPGGPGSAGDPQKSNVERGWIVSQDTWGRVKASVQMSGGQRRNVIWAHPAANTDLLITYPQVSLGDALRGLAGYAEAVTKKGLPTVNFSIFIDNQRVYSNEQERTRGWKEFSVDTREFAGSNHDVTFRVYAEDTGKQHFCFNAAVE